MRFLLVLWISIGCWPQLARATNSPAELESVLADVMEWLPGDFSSRPQRLVETKYGPPPDGLHHDWYRIFARVDVPHIGDNVIYGQLHIGSPDAPIVPGTQILYITTIDEAHGAVSMSGRRIANPSNYESAHLDPDKLKTIAIDPEYGGNCDFRWRRHGAQVVGKLAQPDEDFIDGTCSMTSKKSGLNMTWDAEWVLNADELWIYDNGYIDGTDLFQGREDRTHVRLSRVRQFDCRVSGGDAGNPGTVTLHDGGSSVVLGDATLGLTRIGRVLELSHRNDSGEVLGMAVVVGAAERIALSHGGFTARCAAR